MKKEEEVVVCTKVQITMRDRINVKDGQNIVYCQSTVRFIIETYE